MSLFDGTSENLNHLIHSLQNDLVKAEKGNKSAAQRIRVNTVKLEKVAKVFRKESLLAEKGLKKSRRRKKKARV